MSELNLPKRFEFENEIWAARTGSPIAAIIDEEDTSEDYSINSRHLYKLENGQYAVVFESGCSCYTTADADVTLFKTLKAAKAAYGEFSK